MGVIEEDHFLLRYSSVTITPTLSDGLKSYSVQYDNIDIRLSFNLKVCRMASV